MSRPGSGPASSCSRWSSSRHHLGTDAPCSSVLVAVQHLTDDQVLVAEPVYSQKRVGLRADTVKPPRARTLPIRSLVVIAACVLWILSPVDLMPEAALGPFGLGDDAVALLVMSRTALALYRGSGGRPASKK